MEQPEPLTNDSVLRVSMSHLCDIALYQEEIPYEIWKDEVNEAVQRTNVKLKVVRDIPLTDVKSLSSMDKPELETHGFEWIYQQYPTECGINTADDVAAASPAQRERISRYLQSMTRMLKQKYNCVKVICYDWRVRRADGGVQPEVPNIYSLKGLEGDALRAAKINAAHIVHADASPKQAQTIVRNVLSDDERAEIQDNKYRVRIINLWRPINSVVHSEPLALCDRRTVSTSDWEVVEKVLEHAVEESMYLRRRDHQQWYWMSEQTRNDVLAITVWDSGRPDDLSASVPHCAVMLPAQRPKSKPRESLEMRFIVCTEN